MSGLFGLGAGSPSRFPYEDRPQPSPGVGPGQGQNVRARIVIIFGTGGGLFVYSGTPAAGNLIASITSAAGTDPFGNPYDSDVTVYGSAGTFVQMLAATVARINLGTGDPAETTPGAVATRILGTGGPRILQAIMQSPLVSGSTDFTQMGLGSPSADLVDATAWQVAAQSLPSQGAISVEPQRIHISTGNGTATAEVNITPGNTQIVAGSLTATAGTAAAPTLITTDTWHSLGTLAGYTISEGRYRLTASGNVELDVVVSSAGANASSTAFSVTMAAEYRPPSVNRFPAMGTTRAVTAGDVSPRLVVSPTGVVSVVQTAAVTASLSVNCQLPLT